MQQPARRDLAPGNDARVSAVSRTRVAPRRSRLRAALLVCCSLIPALIALGVVIHAAQRPAAAPTAAPSAAKSRVPSLTSRWLATAITSEVDALLEDPGAPGHVLAGTSTGVWRSSDDGATWHRDTTGLGGKTILALAGAQHPAALFAGSDNGIVSMTLETPGARWQAISAPLGTSPIFSLAVNPATRTVLAGTDTALYRGTEQGQHWQWQRVLHTDLSSVSTVLWAPWGAHTAYAAVFGATPPVYASTDDGRTWKAASAGLPASLPNIQLLAASGGGQQIVLTTMGLGVWRMTGSARWQEISTGLPERHAMPVVSDPHGVLYAGTMGSGVYMKQGNAPWQRLGRQMVGGQYIVLSMTITHSAHPTLLAGTSSGLFRLPLPA